MKKIFSIGLFLTALQFQTNAQELTVINAKNQLPKNERKIFPELTSISDLTSFIEKYDTEIKKSEFETSEQFQERINDYKKIAIVAAVPVGDSSATSVPNYKYDADSQTLTVYSVGSANVKGYQLNGDYKSTIEAAKVFLFSKSGVRDGDRYRGTNAFGVATTVTIRSKTAGAVAILNANKLTTPPFVITGIPPIEAQKVAPNLIVVFELETALVPNQNKFIMSGGHVMDATIQSPTETLMEEKTFTANLKKATLIDPKTSTVYGVIMPRSENNNAVKLGVDYLPVNQEVASALKMEKPSGVFIVNVIKGSNAENLGMQKNDVILSVNNKPIEPSMSGLQDAMSCINIGDKADFDLLRNGIHSTIRASF